MSVCKPYQYTNVTEYLPESGNSFAIGGRKLNEGYVFYLWNAARTSQVLYNLKGEYSSFTFYAGHVDGTKQYNAQLEIYLDGTLSDTVPLTPNDIGKEVTVKTDGVKNLKIKMTSDEELNHYDITYGIYDGAFVQNGMTANAIPKSNMVGSCEPYEFNGGDKNKVVRSAERQKIFMGGDSYTDCLQFYLWNPHSSSQAKFNFEGKYDSISFVIGHIDNTSRYPVTFEFAADGEVIKEVKLNPDDLPVPVTLPLSGVKQLIISMLSSQEDNTYDYYYGLGAIQLSPDFQISVVPVTGITLFKSSLSLTEGSSAILTATVSPDDADDKSVTWTSNSTETATVDASGRVTAAAAGTAVITATTSDGGYSASCRVSVVEEEKKVTGVTLSQSTLTLTEGETATLRATVAPSNADNKSVAWTSNSTETATVDANGRVTAVAAGTTVITVTTSDGGYTATCRVSVAEGEKKVTGVTLSQSALTLTEGETATLRATVVPTNADNKTVNWSSSNSFVATVDSNGLVIAVAPGQAVIRATTADGGFTAQCRVTVAEKPSEGSGKDPGTTSVKVTGVKLSKTALTMDPGQSETLTATVSPAAADNKAVTWSTNNAAVATVTSSGRVSALAAGAAVITARTDDGGFTAQCRVIVKGESKPAAVEVHFSHANVYNQGQFSDVPADQWYTDGVKQAFEFGLMNGVSARQFDPQGNVTIAQAITMAARIHSIYTTGSESFMQGDPWYQVYLDYAFQNGIISYAFYNADVTKNATRAQFAEIFANALPEEALAPANDVVDGAIPDVPMTEAYAAHVYKLYRAGILNGSDVNGTFFPASYITRQEAATIVSRMAESGNRKTFTL